MSQFSFNASEHNAAVAYEALPKGWYQARLIESEIKPTSNQTGQYIEYKVEILAPPFAKGRKTSIRFNTVNANTEAVRIGMEQLAALSLAVKVPVWGNTEQLHNIPFHLRLKVTKGGVNASTGEPYEDSNDASGYDVIDTNRQLASQAVAPAAPGAAPASPFPTQPGVVAQSIPVYSPAAMPASAPPASAPPVQTPLPTQQPAAAPAPVQPAPQPVAAPAQPQQAPAQQAPAQPWEGAQQPWQQPAQSAAAPAQQPAQQPVEQQTAAQAPAPTPAPAQPWANAEVNPQVQNATPAAGATPAAPAEPPHPAQSLTPPWQQAQ